MTSAGNLKEIIVLVTALMILGGAPVLLTSIGSSESQEDQVHSYPSKDADRNRIFDTLDEHLQEMEQGDRETVIVRMMESVTSAKLEELRAAVGDFRVVSNKENPDDDEGRPWTLIPAFAAALTKEQINTLGARSDVRHIANEMQLDISMDTAKLPTGVARANDNLVNSAETGVDGGRSPAGYDSGDIVICVIDSGVDDEHEALDDGQVVRWKTFLELEPGQDPNEPVDAGGHGTNVAGVAAGHGSLGPKGAAPGAALAVAQAFPAQIAAGHYNVAMIALEWCADWKDAQDKPIVDVINGSWGFADPEHPEECNDGMDDISDLVNSIVDQGIVAVFAAGNDGPGLCSVQSPAAASKAIAVGSVSDPRNEGCSAGVFMGDGWYLNPGSSRGSFANGVYKPDVLAPGVCVTAPVLNRPPPLAQNQYAPGSGTSLASPFVAGVVALMIDAYPDLVKDHGAGKVKEILMNDATHWGPAERAQQPQSMDYGAGIIRADLSVLTACQLTNPSCSYNTAAPANPVHIHKPEDLAATDKLDELEFTTDSTAGNWPIGITLIVPDAGANKNFDMQLIRKTDGVLIASSGTLLSRQETINYTQAGSLTYVIKVKSVSGSGSYWLDLSAGVQAGGDLVLTRDE